ncbi:MAG TPA: ethanolamine utilization protein EutJ [Anaerolineaceae bacterium]|nr:ethanolamine utilization protein EutJ [Anaerolineaceae bacterium]
MTINSQAREWVAQARQVLENPTEPGLKMLDPAAFPLHVGVDLGTAYTVLLVLDHSGQPVAGSYRFAQVVRDGLVVDFIGAVDLLREMKAQVEERLGAELTTAWTAYPPGVPQAERRATAHVLQGAGMECLGLVDEPSAANHVLGLSNGAIVDVGGGTTGVAVVQDGQVVYTADEPTGGTHFTLTVAGALDLSFDQAERVKTDLREQERLFPVLRPVMEKVAVITERHIAGYQVPEICLVGGTCLFPRMAEVVEEVTGIPTRVPLHPLFVTPLGIARTGLARNGNAS